MTLSVTCAFDGGNIIVKNQEDALDIRLDIRKDNASDFFQWFYYRVTGAKGEACRMIIENAKDAAYTGGWENYRACASYDRKTVFITLISRPIVSSATMTALRNIVKMRA